LYKILQRQYTKERRIFFIAHCFNDAVTMREKLSKYMTNVKVLKLYITVASGESRVPCKSKERQMMLPKHSFFGQLFYQNSRFSEKYKSPSN
jgi:hypothetical protein